MNYPDQILGWYWQMVRLPCAWHYLDTQYYEVLWHVLTFCSSSLPSMGALLGKCPGKPGSTTWLIPWWNCSAKDTIPTRLAQWTSMTERRGTGFTTMFQIQPRVLQQKTNTEIKRETLIQCFCLRWDTRYCLDMTGKREITRDAQENVLVLCMCVAELLLLIQWFITLCEASVNSQIHVSMITHTRSSSKYTYTHTPQHTTDDHTLGQRSFSQLALYVNQ